MHNRPAAQCTIPEGTMTQLTPQELTEREERINRLVRDRIDVSLVIGDFVNQAGRRIDTRCRFEPRADAHGGA